MDSSPEAVNVRTAAVAAEGKRESGDRSEDEKPADLQIVDDDQEDDESLEYVFATAGARAWSASLAWITAFFVSFFVLGAFITVPLFALVYLRFAGKASWWAAAAYAVVTGALIFVVFRYVVFLPLPTGVIPFLQV
jgi:fatty acid desaturase